MAKRERKLTQKRLQELLVYEPHNGVFWWRVRRGGTPAGVNAGTKITPRNRYVVIYVDRVPYVAHRLAWLYVYGEWPQKEIDHIDGDPSNNRIDNLRDVDRFGNTQNLRRARKDNKLGCLGVSPYGNQFKAQIQAYGKKRHIGYYATVEEARAAYMAAKKVLHSVGWGENYGEAKG